MKKLPLIILLLLLAGCAAPGATVQPSSTPLPPSATSAPTQTPEPSPTPTPIPWQSYKMTFSIRIGNVGKIWMPVPREWDGIGMTNISIVDISPKPADTYRDSQGNLLVFWNAGSHSAKDYSVIFSVDLAPIKYDVIPALIGDYDKSSPDFQRYTQPSSRIESDNPIIIELAKQIIDDQTNPYEQARLIHKWVSNNIKGQGEDDETAISTLEKRNGACGGHSFLFIALLRSSGIPARAVSGIPVGH